MCKNGVDLPVGVAYQYAQMKRATQILLTESDRFLALARDEALKAVRAEANDEPGCYGKDATDARRKCKDHLLRSETFKAAAALIA